MSAVDDLIRAARDMDYSRHLTDPREFIAARERARIAARELFPPSAKALDWNDDFETACGWTDESKMTGYHVDCREPGKWRAQYRKGNSLEMLGRAFPTRDSAKAFCESHHQSRFKELLS